MNTKAVALGLALIGSPAMAGSYTMALQEAPPQSAKFFSGHKAVIDVLGQSGALIGEPEAPDGKRVKLPIYVRNLGSSDFNFGVESVHIKTVAGVEIPLLTYQALAHAEAKRRGWAAAALALGAMGRGMQASQAGWSNSTTTFNTNVGINGMANTTTYNPAAAAQAQAAANAETAAEAGAMRQASEQRMAALQGVIQTTTVAPGSNYGGVVEFDAPKEVRSAKEPVPVVIEVTAGAETHVFHGAIGKVR